MLKDTQYAKEIWTLYEEGELHPDIELTGDIEEDTQAADVDDAPQEIKAALDEEQQRQERIREAGELI